MDVYTLLYKFEKFLIPDDIVNNKIQQKLILFPSFTPIRHTSVCSYGLYCPYTSPCKLILSYIKASSCRTYIFTCSLKIVIFTSLFFSDSEVSLIPDPQETVEDWLGSQQWIKCLPGTRTSV